MIIVNAILKFLKNEYIREYILINVINLNKI